MYVRMYTCIHIYGDFIYNIIPLYVMHCYYATIVTHLISIYSSFYIHNQAGNYKKFSVFCKMLSSAFSKDTDSVLVDLLTYSDLEMLKARKTGKDPSTISSSTNSKAQLKRYVILTYQSEFDRVHYPLPLAFEDKPNVEAMQRTIKKLRANEANRSLNDISMGGESGNHVSKLVGRLREENTELRHR